MSLSEHGVPTEPQPVSDAASLDPLMEDSAITEFASPPPNRAARIFNRGASVESVGPHPSNSEVTRRFEQFMGGYSPTMPTEQLLDSLVDLSDGLSRRDAQLLYGKIWHALTSTDTSPGPGLVKAAHMYSTQRSK